MNIDQLRTERNARLVACDFYFLQDMAEETPDAELLAIKLYRQALRDLPARYAGEEEIESVDWPEKPF